MVGPELEYDREPTVYEREGRTNRPSVATADRDLGTSADESVELTLSMSVSTVRGGRCVFCTLFSKMTGSFLRLCCFATGCLLNQKDDACEGSEYAGLGKFALVGLLEGGVTGYGGCGTLAVELSGYGGFFTLGKGTTVSSSSESEFLLEYGVIVE